MKIMSMFAALSVVALASSTAHANDALGAGAVLAVEVTPVVMGIADLTGHQGSKAYGVAEIAFGGTSAALNIGLLALFSSQFEPNAGVVALFGGAAVIDAAVMVHGFYLLAREDKPSPLRVTVGSVRGTFAPTLVSDGKTSAPGVGLGGTF